MPWPMVVKAAVNAPTVTPQNNCDMIAMNVFMQSADAPCFAASR